MRIALVSLGCLLSLSASAAAEDFTGFYAGMNAGYAAQSGDGKTRGLGADALRASDPAMTGPNALPPSAQDASRALQTRDRSALAAPVRPR